MDQKMQHATVSMDTEDLSVKSTLMSVNHNPVKTMEHVRMESTSTAATVSQDFMVPTVRILMPVSLIHVQTMEPVTYSIQLSTSVTAVMDSWG